MSQYRQNADIAGLPRPPRFDGLRNVLAAIAVGAVLGVMLAYRG